MYIISIPTSTGFTKEQLRVQVTSKGVLRINCERQGIENIWHRFGKEFPIPPYCETNDVSAKFERGVLSIMFPKLITPANKPQEQETITNPPQESSMPQQLSDEPKAPIKAQAQVVDDQQEAPKKEEPIIDEKENNKIEERVENDQKKVRTNDELLETKEVIKTAEVKGKRQGKMTQRLKTRILDFNISLRSRDDKDVNQLGFGFGDIKPKKGKLLANMIVATLLVLVLGVYVKNALWS